MSERKHTSTRFPVILRLQWILLVVMLAGLATVFIVIRSHESNISADLIFGKLHSGMTTVEIEKALGFSSGYVSRRIARTEVGAEKPYYAKIKATNFLSAVSTQEEIVLLFDGEKRLASATAKRIHGLEESWDQRQLSKAP